MLALQDPDLRVALSQPDSCELEEPHHQIAAEVLSGGMVGVMTGCNDGTSVQGCTFAICSLLSCSTSANCSRRASMPQNTCKQDIGVQSANGQLDVSGAHIVRQIAGHAHLHVQAVAQQGPFRADHSCCEHSPLPPARLCLGHGMLLVIPVHWVHPAGRLNSLSKPAHNVFEMGGCWTGSRKVNVHAA